MRHHSGGGRRRVIWRSRADRARGVQRISRRGDRWHHHSWRKPQRGGARRWDGARQRHPCSGRIKCGRREPHGDELHEQRGVLDWQHRLPRVVHQYLSHWGLRHLGVIEHSYTAGSKDAGVYIGQCYPCDAVVDDIISEHNGLGYSGTNSGGELYIVNSVFRNNRVGIVPNSGSYELCYPQRETTIIGNLVHDNNQADTPAIDVALLAMGNGILVAGGIGNVIERNLVFGHDRTGIGMVPFLEETPSDDLPTRDEWELDCATSRTLDITIPDGAILWDSYDNVVRDNVVSDSGSGDLAVASVLTDTSTLGNCFTGNDAATTRPADLQTIGACGAAASGDWSIDALNVIAWLTEVESAPPSVDWQTAPLPDLVPQPDMPDAATAPTDPMTASMPAIDVGAVGLPADPRS
ncbi:MAG: hypothetical protein EBS20_03985 [Actinobacteria bacterium]|nr:hypothetical protein [Actinomycetota bacterium]